MRNRYIALIPAYEPDEKLKKLADELAERGFDIVVVDDGSGSGKRFRKKSFDWYRNVIATNGEQL